MVITSWSEYNDVRATYPKGREATSKAKGDWLKKHGKEILQFKLTQALGKTPEEGDSVNYRGNTYKYTKFQYKYVKGADGQKGSYVKEQRPGGSAWVLQHRAYRYVPGLRGGHREPINTATAIQQWWKSPAGRKQLLTIQKNLAQGKTATPLLASNGRVRTVYKKGVRIYRGFGDNLDAYAPTQKSQALTGERKYKIQQKRQKRGGVTTEGLPIVQIQKEDDAPATSSGEVRAGFQDIRRKISNAITSDSELAKFNSYIQRNFNVSVKDIVASVEGAYVMVPRTDNEGTFYDPQMPSDTVINRIVKYLNSDADAMEG